MAAILPPARDPTRGIQKKKVEFEFSSPVNAVGPYRIEAKHRGAKSRAALIAPLKKNI